MTILAWILVSLVLSSTRPVMQAPGAQGAAPESLLAERARSCGPAGADLEAWPPGGRLRVHFRTFFAQPVDDQLAGEQERNLRRLVLGALTPLGLAVDSGPAAGASVLEIVGVGEALAPDGPVDRPIFTGASWKGLISVFQGGRCLAGLPFGSRLRPPDALVTVVVDDPSAAPYLEAAEAPLVEQLLVLAQRMRGASGLSRIALSDADWRVRVGAVELIADQALLTGIARTAKAPWVRAAAVARLSTQATLDAIAQTDKDPEVRKAALDRLAELARNPR